MICRPVALNAEYKLPFSLRVQNPDVDKETSHANLGDGPKAVPIEMVCNSDLEIAVRCPAADRSVVGQQPGLCVFEVFLEGDCSFRGISSEFDVG